MCSLGNSNPVCVNAVFVCTGSSKDESLVRSVATALTILWSRHAKSPRLATPALRTAEVLLSRTQLLSSPDNPSDLLGIGSHWTDCKEHLFVTASMHTLCHTKEPIQC